MGNSERRRRHQAGPTNSRTALRTLIVLAALAALAVVLTPTGSAKPPPPPSGTYQACLIAGDGTGACTPTASGGDYSVLVGASVQLQVTIKNDSASNQTLDYANVNVPASIIGLSIDTAHIPQPATYKTYASTSTASTLQLRGLGLAPGASRTVAFFVNSPTSSCTDGNWTTRAQSSSTGSAFVFTNPPSQSGGLTSLVAVSCQLAFQNQPTAAIQTKTITSAPYNPLGPNVSVGPTPALPVALNGGSVTLGYDPGAFDPAGSSFTGTGTSFSGGVATFSSLKATGTGGPFTLNAHAAGFDTDALSSPPFAITQEGNACNPGTACNITGHDASGKALVQILTSTGFGFVGTSPSAVPQDANGDYPAGCQSWTPTNGVTGFVEFDGRTDGPSTSMTVTYDMPMNALKARYGKNVGQQFIPVCIGAKLVDSSGQAQDCVPETRGWLGDELANGAFTGGTFQSVCGPEGYYWGIISSFQDKLDQTANPVVTSWGSGQIGGTNYRSFTMSIPAGWDLHGSG